METKIKIQEHNANDSFPSMFNRAHQHDLHNLSGESNQERGCEKLNYGQSSDEFGVYKGCFRSDLISHKEVSDENQNNEQLMSTKRLLKRRIDIETANDKEPVSSMRSLVVIEDDLSSEHNPLRHHSTQQIQEDQD